MGKGLSYNNYYEMAQDYWSSEQNINLTVSDILFEGEAKIIEIIEEYSHKK